MKPLPSLEDLYRKAKEDLGLPKALLEWLFLHAKAVGALAEVQSRIRFAEEMHRVAWESYPGAPEDRVATVVGSGPPTVEIENLRSLLREAAERVKATENVMGLLERVASVQQAARRAA